MKVYGIYEGCRFEGGSCRDTLYSSIGKARVEAMKIVAIKQAELVSFREDSKNSRGIISECFSKDFEEVYDNCWSDKLDVVKVQEFELI